MRIGIEASRAVDTGRGIERYTRSLIEALGVTDSENEYILISADKTLSEKFSLPKNFTVEHPGKRFRMIYRRGVGLLGRFLFRDIDIFHFPNSYVWYSKYARTIVTLHDLAPFHFPEYFFNTESDLSRYKKDLLYIKKNADRIIAVSEYSKSDIVEKIGFPGEKIDVIYNGVNCKFRPLQLNQEQISVLKHKFNIELPFILFVGGLDFRKNVGVLLKAFDAVVKKNDIRHKLVIVGNTYNGSKLRVPVEEILKDLNISARIIFAGAVNEEDLLILYNSADLFVFPSVFEGFGFPVLESMACGCPTICSNAASLPEVAGDAAILFNPFDITALERVITEVLGSKDLREALRFKGFKRIQNFSWEKNSLKVIALYKELLN